LIARDPYILFAYWDLTRQQYLEAAAQAHDGKVFLEVFFADGGDRVAQIHIWESHRNWYLQLSRPDTSFYARIGFYQADGSFVTIATSPIVQTPRDTLSGNTEAKFVTIPFVVPFKDLRELVSRQAQAKAEPLAEALYRLEKTSTAGLPFPESPAPRALTEDESHQLLSYLASEDAANRIGSFEISELLRRRFEILTSSGASPGVAVWGGLTQEEFISGVSSVSSFGSFSVSSLSSPFGASFGAQKRGFHMHVNAELIIYGGTEPDAKLRIDGEEIKLSKDGTFHYHFVFPDGGYHIPIQATSADGVETRSALLSFLRATETTGDVRKTGQPVMDEPIGRIP
jgi:hypothetical protein